MGESLRYSLSKRESTKWRIRRVFNIWCYIFDYLKYGEFYLIWILIKTLFVSKSNSTDRIANTYFGKFLVRKNTMDFKMANNAYEKNIINLFKKNLIGKDIIIDIGANCGLYSINAALVGVDAISFEPIIDNYNALIKNIELNNFTDRITTYNYALGNKEETVNFNYNQFNTGSSSKFKTRFTTVNRDVTIKIFDNLQLSKLNNLTNIQVKLDVEGMEVNVIQGMKEFIKSTKDICFFIETKHVGAKEIQEALLRISNFEFIQLDPFNMFAIKTKKI